MEKYCNNEGVNAYMYIDGVEVPQDSYEVAMLQKNSLTYVMAMELRSVNGEAIPYYNVSGMTEYKNLTTYGTVEAKRIIQLIGDVLCAVDEVSGYLLGVNNLILQEDYIFYSNQNKVYTFAYLPEYGVPVRQQLKALLEASMKRMDHSNSRDSDFVYDLYQKCSVDNFDMKALAEETENYLCRGNESKQEQEIVQENEEKNSEVSTEDVLDEIFGTKEKRKPGKAMGRAAAAAEEKKKERARRWPGWRIAFMCVMALTVLGVVGYVAMNYMTSGVMGSYKIITAILLTFVVEILVYMEVSKRLEDAAEDKASKKETSAAKETKYKPTEETMPVEKKPQITQEQNAVVAVERVEYPQIQVPAKANVIDIASRRSLSGYILYARARANSNIYINQPYTVIGRGKLATCHMPNESVSRIHARLYEVNNQLVVEDLGSKNGTFVNEYPITEGYPAVLFVGDVIRFGSESYELRKVS